MTKNYSCLICTKLFDSSHKLRGHLAWCGIDESVIKSRMEKRGFTLSRGQQVCVNCKVLFVGHKSRKFCSLKCNASTNKNKRLASLLYGKTLRELELYRELQKVCEICGRPETTKANRSNLAYDHDHKTGMFRGVLCFKCNTTFDYFQKYQNGFIAYALKHNVR